MNDEGRNCLLEVLHARRLENASPGRKNSVNLMLGWLARRLASLEGEKPSLIVRMAAWLASQDASVVGWTYIRTSG